MAVPDTRVHRRSLVGSAARLGDRDSEYARRRELPWQRQALEYIDRVPELNFASHFYSRMLKQLIIFPALLGSDGQAERIDEGIPVQLLDRIQDPAGGRSQILGNYGRLMFVTGEGSLFGRELGGERERWSFLWNDELKVEYDGRGNVTKIIHRPVAAESGKEYSPEQAVIYRMWTPHPRRSSEADSPMRAVLDVAEELIVLTQSVYSTAVTRMTNGVLLMPQEISPGAAEPAGDEDARNDPFADDIADLFEQQKEHPGEAAAKVPYIIYAAYEYLDRIRHLPLHDPQNDYLERDLRKEAVERLARGLDFPPEILLGLGQSNHWCQVEATEIFTRERGWVRHDSLSVGDVVRTLNHETGLAQWQPVEDIYRAEVVDEPMVSLDKRYHNSISTHEHRWPVIRRDGSREWVTSRTMRVTDRIIRSASGSDLPQMPKYHDAFVELVAWYVSEGTCTWPSERNCQVRIGQSHRANPQLVETLRSTLRELHGPPVDDLRKVPGWRSGATVAAPAWKEVREQRGMTLMHLNKSAFAPILDVMESWQSKVVRRDFILDLTLEQLNLFLDTFALGDGMTRASGHLDVNQRDPRRLAPLELAAVLAGRATRIYTRMTGGFTEPRVQTHLTITPGPKLSTVAEKRETTYTGTIWCPVTENGSWLARHEGAVFYTGNSALQVLGEKWKSHGAALAEQFCDELAEVYLRPSLREQEFPNWKRVIVGYDESQVVVKADRADDAIRAFDRGLIGDAGARSLLNIPSEWAPSEEERARYLAIKLRNPLLISDNGGKAEEGPPAPGPEGDSGRRTRIVGSSEREVGAAEMALMRCRELAGLRIRNKSYWTALERNCSECVQRANGKSNELVASAIGADVVLSLGADPKALVKGGSDPLRSLLMNWGHPQTQAEALCEMIETYAARTLFEEEVPSLSSGLVAHIEQMKEVADALLRQA